MPAPMVRKQIYLTPELDRRLRRAAARLRRPEAEVLREALTSYFGDASDSSKPTDDALWGLVGAGASGEHDLSERVDEVLYGKSSPRR